MRTRNDLRQTVARRLMISQQGQEPSGEDARRIDDAIRNAHAFLEEERIAYWDFGDNDNEAVIPDAVFFPLSRFLEAYCAPEFLSGPERAQAEVHYGSAFTELRRLTEVRFGGQSSAPDRF